MRFIIEQTVFASHTTDPLALMALFHACRDPRRHLVLTDPTFRGSTVGSPVVAWLSRQPWKAKEQIEHILTSSLRLQSTAPGGLSARVTAADSSHWRVGGGAPRSVTVQDAARLAQTPLKVLVENQRYDGAFLRKVISAASDNERRVLERALEESWIVIENGGGIDDLRAWARQLANDTSEHPTVWVARLRL